MDKFERLDTVVTHINNVQRNCYALGLKLIKAGRFEIGRNLIANGYIHDNSKFKGIEFDELFTGSPILMDVVKHHSSTNQHHPEYWGGIHNMPEIYIAEMVCDCAARSSEFGTDLRHFFTHTATDKYGFRMDDDAGQKITYFLNMLLGTPFK